MLLSCEKEAEVVLKPVEEETTAKDSYVFAIGSTDDEDAAETKTILGSDAEGVFSAWESGDNLIYKINNEDHGTSGVTVGTPVQFAITDVLVENDVIYAWFPYCVDETGTPDGVWFNVPHNQTQGTNFNLDAMPMVAKPITMTAAMVSAWTSDKTAPIATAQFANLGSLINFKVYNTNSAYNSEKLRSISFDAGSSVISGTFALDLTAIDFTDEAQVTYTSGMLVDDSDLPVGHEEELGRSAVITTELSSNTAIPTSKGTALNVYMVVLPGTYAGTITVTTTKATYTYPLTSREFKRSEMKKLGLDLNSGNATRVDYVSLDWTYPGTGRDVLDNTVGVQWKGIGTDYNSDSHGKYILKFDDTGDYLIVKTDKAIGKVSFGYKKIGGANNSTFTIQESADGQTFTDVQALTSTGSSGVIGSLETTNSFADDCRFVRMYYTKGSNVGVGEITITQLDPSTKRISVQSNLVAPVGGATDATLSYTAQNFSDDISVTRTGCVTSASKTADGVVTYTVAPNYEADAASGTIVLTSTATPSITRTVHVTQPASSLTTSASPTLVVTIPNDANTAEFSITTPEFGWNATAAKGEGDVNLQIKTGESTYSASHSGLASADAQTITVYSTTAAAASLVTLGTVTIYRTVAAGDDPQALTVTIKKAATGGGGGGSTTYTWTLPWETTANDGKTDDGSIGATIGVYKSNGTLNVGSWTNDTANKLSYFSCSANYGFRIVLPVANLTSGQTVNVSVSKVFGGRPGNYANRTFGIKYWTNKESSVTTVTSSISATSSGVAVNESFNLAAKYANSSAVLYIEIYPTAAGNAGLQGTVEVEL